MTTSALRLLSLASTLAASMIALSACSSDLPDSEELVGAPEESVGKNEDSVSTSLPVGTTLIATADVNLRTGPSTSASILHVVPEGASVVVQESAPQSGFYKVKHSGSVGWSSGQYYKVAPAPPAPSVTAADLLAALGSCQQLAGTTKFKNDVGGSSTVPVCGLPSAVWWTADFDVDCDGGLSSTCKNDPDYQAETAATTSTGKPLDASTLPYVVIPGSSNGFNYKTAGLKLGSVVAVIYKGQVAYAILGDVGPMGVIGEGSYALAKQLGMNPSPTSGGVDSGVTYVAFTGAAGVVTKKEDNAQAVQIGQSLASQLIQSH